MVASMIEVFTVNFSQVIANKMHARYTKISISLLFSYLLTELCRLMKVPILSGVDDEVMTIKIEDINKT